MTLTIIFYLKHHQINKKLAISISQNTIIIILLPCKGHSAQDGKAKYITGIDDDDPTRRLNTKGSK